MEYRSRRLPAEKSSMFLVKILRYLAGFCRLKKFVYNR